MLYFSIFFYAVYLIYKIYLRLFKRGSQNDSILFWCLPLAFICQTTSIIFRWYYLRFPPLTNMHETLVLLSWLIVLFLFSSKKIAKYELDLIGTAFILLVAAALFNSTITPLDAAMKNSWILIHVPSCITSYALFFISFIVSIYALTTSWGKNIKENEILNKIVIKLIFWGVVLLAVGIITGSLWAKTAWGYYWQWDPKEIWALVTLIVYILCLLFSFRGKVSRICYILSIIGFITIIISYFGVNLFMEGLHSYK
jgi:cytochrome c-type biogenesis protein CcsB